VAYKNDDPDPLLCVDPTSTVSKTDNGNANAQIPDPGAHGRHDENPPIYYGTAFMRQLVWLQSLSVSYPHEEILQLADDVSAAFHHILYDPLMALVFATVWGMYLVIPVGTIFGACNSPSFHIEAGETRSHLASSWPDATFLLLQDLVEQVVLPPSPTPAEAASFVQAIADSPHHGVANHTSANPERRLPTVSLTTAARPMHLGVSAQHSMWLFGLLASHVDFPAKTQLAHLHQPSQVDKRCRCSHQILRFLA